MKLEINYTFILPGFVVVIDVFLLMWPLENSQLHMWFHCGRALCFYRIAVNAAISPGCHRNSTHFCHHVYLHPAGYPCRFHWMGPPTLCRAPSPHAGAPASVESSGSEDVLWQGGRASPFPFSVSINKVPEQRKQAVCPLAS